jgi:hypothetical protein
MVQRVSPDGSLESPPIIGDPFRTFPLCSVDLYQRMGVKAATSKYPLFWCGALTTMVEGGNHHSPNGEQTILSHFLQGVTHHFKWRRTVTERLVRRVNSSHTFRHESTGFQAYLERHDYRVPVEGAFPYTRAELIRRALIKTITPKSIVYQVLRQAQLRLSAHARAVEPDEPPRTPSGSGR